MEDRWRVQETADYICNRNFSVVAAQFPDELLPEAVHVAWSIQDACKDRGHSVLVYVLADTTYNSLSVDEVAASHVDAHCVVHYGRASLTKLSRLPAFFVFPQQALDVDAAAEALASSPLFATASDPATCVVVLLDQPYLDQLPAFQDAVRRRTRCNTLVFADVSTRHMQPASAAVCCYGQQQPGDRGCKEGENHPSCCDRAQPAGSGSPGEGPPAAAMALNALSAAGYTWDVPGGLNPRSTGFAWVGAPDAPALSQLQLTRSTAPWVCFDPGSGRLTEGVPPEVSRMLKRRYYFVERARNAAVVGVLVATLGTAGYKEAVEAVRKAAAGAGKKTYTLLMGKPSPAKLANFPEIEVFVMIADPQGQILDSKEYLSPIITPHEAMLAFTEGAWDAEHYRLDFDGVLQEVRIPSTTEAQALSSQESGTVQDRAEEEPRFSLLDGSYHAEGGSSSRVESEEGSSGAVTALAVQAQQALTVSTLPDGAGQLMQPQSAADFFVHKRSWTGLEAPLVVAQPKAAEAAVPGRAGRAAGYVDEPR